MKHFLRHVFAAVSMCTGASLVFALMYFMNMSSLPPKEKEESAQVEFDVKKTPPKPKPRPRAEKPRPNRTVQRSAPAPSLSASLAGPSFALPQFEMSSLSSAAEQALAGSSDDQVFTANAVDEKPRPLQRVAPAVPDQATRGGITGFVKVRFLIDARGSVERPQVVDAQPQGVFEGEVLMALSRWTYEPARYHGEPVKVSVTQTFRFD